MIQLKTHATMGPALNLSIGAVAGTINVLMTTPLWMMSTQLAVQRSRGTKDGVKPYAGMWEGLTRCYAEEGVEGLWKGVGPNLMLVSNPTIHFFVYERVRMVFAKAAEARGTAMTSMEFFFMGAVAKMVATLMTYPIQIAQSQLRNDRKNAKGERKYKDTADCLRKIYAQVGLAGWFRGMTAKLWQTVLTAAFQFMTYEKMRTVITVALGGTVKTARAVC